MKMKFLECCTGLALAFAVANADAAVIINEVLFDPANDLSGDANGDGTREASGDEFVEILNTGLATVDIGGWTLSDDDGGAFAFPAGTTIDPGEFIVLFGGGTPTGFSGQVFTDDGSIGTGFSNSGDLVQLIDVPGTVNAPLTVVDSLDYTTLEDAGLGSDVSLAFDGTNFVDQDSLIPGVLFTPGASNTTVIPEPSSSVFVALAASGLGIARRRRK